jgi:hypothetical protein
LTEDYRRQLRQALSSGKLPGLERIAGPWGGLNSAQAGTAYAYALWAAEVWLESDGSESIRQLLRYPDRIPQLTEKLNRALSR